MDYLVDDYDQALSPLRQCNNISSNLINDLLSVFYKLHQQKRFSKPMPWIGIYIAVASLYCIMLMVADFIHGLKNRKLWLPCKYFTLDAASLTVIAVAVKLPLDLNNPMPGVMDQQAKLGSVVFMCVMMTFLLPSLASMNRKDIVTNTIALVILVITLVVNVCIQINTGLVSYSEDRHITEYNMGGHTIKSMDIFGYANREIAIIYVAILLMLLMIYICSALMILKSKQNLESKFQEAHLIVQKQAARFTVESLKQIVINYGIMAGTSTPQLMTICSATSSASAVICVIITVLHVIKTFNNYVNERRYTAYDSDYKRSILVIFIIQSIGIALGAIALFWRFYAPLISPLYKEGIWKLIKFYEVESYWTHTLSDWKDNRQYSFSHSNFKLVFYILQTVSLTLFTLSQKAIVITCKAIRIIPVLILKCVNYFVCVLRAVFRLVSPFGISLPMEPESNRIFCQYVLQPQDDMELADVTVNVCIESVKRSIQNAEKKQPSKLMQLLQNSRDFQGVMNFDSLPVQSLAGIHYPNCWSLPVVTLATIALSLRRIQGSTLKDFLKAVSEGLVYVKLVEKSLNNQDELVSVQEAAERLWLDVEVKRKWSGNNLHDSHFLNKTANQIVEWFKDKATNMLTEAGSATDIISANSMRRVTQTLINIDERDTNISEERNTNISQEGNANISQEGNANISQEPDTNISQEHHTNIDVRDTNIDEHDVSQGTLFRELRSMIADILAACLTNLPQIIVTKCHASVIEKREESVHAAATLLGKTSVIINALQNRELPNLNAEELLFIDKWREHLPAPAR